MLTSSSPSPTLHPNAAAFPRTYTTSRRSQGSPRSPAPTFSPRFNTSIRSPRGSITGASSDLPPASPSSKDASRESSPLKRTTSDAWTQYTPPHYPPTAFPIARQAAKASSDIEVAQAASRRREAPLETTATASPAEPKVWEDPQPLSQKPPIPGQASSSAANATPISTAMPEGSSAVEQSPTKRARPSTGRPVKTVPEDYWLCDPKDLSILISDMLMELVRINEGMELKDRQLTRFHSRAPPGISVRDYLLRLVVHATLSPPILLSMVYYVDRLCTLYPAFNISSLTVHRFLITAATVAAKGLSDSFWTNNTYARVGGISTRELALLELEFLEKLEWRIVPRPEVLVDYYRGLVERNDAYEMEEGPREGPSSDGTDSKASVD